MTQLGAILPAWWLAKAAGFGRAPKCQESTLRENAEFGRRDINFESAVAVSINTAFLQTIHNPALPPSATSQASFHAHSGRSEAWFGPTTSERRDPGSHAKKKMSFGGQTPTIIVLKEGTDASQGKGQIISNIQACLAVQDTIRSTLGPYGGDLLLVDENGRQTITNDGATVMKVCLASSFGFSKT